MKKTAAILFPAIKEYSAVQTGMENHKNKTAFKLFCLVSGSRIIGRLLSVELREDGVFLCIEGMNSKGARGRWTMAAARVVSVKNASAPAVVDESDLENLQ